MGKYAVVKNDYIENLIAIEEAQIPEMEEELQCELVDAVPLGLSIGDLRVNGNWTRNIDGVQTVLTERATYDELEAALFEVEAKLDRLEGVENDE